MNKKYKNSEKGQAIIYLVLGLVVFFGFVALAIDGGMALADRRHAQNGADAASLAGGGKAAYDLVAAGVTANKWSCGYVHFAMNNAESAAQTRAAANGFSINPPSAHNYVTTYCNPNYLDAYIDVTVDISSTTQSNFLQIISPNALHNEVEAVTRVKPEHSFGYGNAIIALNPAACSDPGSEGGIMYGNSDGSTDIIINGGGIFSNGCLRGNGKPIIDITCPSGNVGCGAIGNDVIEGNAQWNPPTNEISGTIQYSEFDIGINPTWSPSGTCTYNGVSGTYKKAKDLQQDLSKGPVNLSSGLWCIDGNLSINANDKLSGTGITLFFPNGDLTINGTPDINISAQRNSPFGSAIPDVLIYLPAPYPFNPAACPNHTIKLNGSETSVFDGLILATCAHITLNGTGGNTYTGQVIGWDVEVGGGADLMLTYDGGKNHTTPTSINLHK
jgi:hypothetical protein